MPLSNSPGHKDPRIVRIPYYVAVPSFLQILQIPLPFSVRMSDSDGPKTFGEPGVWFALWTGISHL